MILYLYSVGSVLAVSLVSFVGAFTLSLKAEVWRRYLFVLVSLAVGALVGDAFIHLIPEALEGSSNPALVSLAIISGVLIFFALEKFLHWHHHEVGGERCPAIHPVGRMVIFSDGVHNFVDGLIIGASYLVSLEVGLATTIAVILHEIPQEIGDFGVLLHAGYSAGRALWFNFLSALMALVGTALALLVGQVAEFLVTWLIPLAAGGFIYIAMTDLIPEMHKTKSGWHSLLQFVAMIVGLAAMFALLFLE